MSKHYLAAFTIGLSALTATAMPAAAQKSDAPGVTDTEIKIGQTVPYSGPASAFGLVGKTIAAYFNKINTEGGINGRKIRFISYDDAYSPPKTVEQTRRLIENDEVLLVFANLGTPTNSAIQSYLNAKKVPQLFIFSGAARFNDPAHYPWTMSIVPGFQTEARIYAKYLIDHHPNGKVGILYQNDDYGKEYVKGLKEALRGRIDVVAEAPYETSDPTVDSQTVVLKDSGADIFLDVATPKFAAQAIKKVAEIGWKPIHLLNLPSNSVGAVLTPAGLRNAKDVLSTSFYKDPTDPTWKNDRAVMAWSAFMDRYFPAGERANKFSVEGYIAAQSLVHVLERCGDILTRENVLKQATSIKKLELGMLLPGISINTGPNDYRPIKRMQMMRFNGERWQLFGSIMNDDESD